MIILSFCSFHYDVDVCVRGFKDAHNSGGKCPVEILFCSLDDLCRARARLWPSGYRGFVGAAAGVRVHDTLKVVGETWPIANLISCIKSWIITTHASTHNVPRLTDFPACPASLVSRNLVVDRRDGRRGMLAKSSKIWNNMSFPSESRTEEEKYCSSYDVNASVETNPTFRGASVSGSVRTVEENFEGQAERAVVAEKFPSVDVADDTLKKSKELPEEFYVPETAFDRLLLTVPSSMWQPNTVVRRHRRTANVYWAFLLLGYLIYIMCVSTMSNQDAVMCFHLLAVPCSPRKALVGWPGPPFESRAERRKLMHTIANLQQLVLYTSYVLRSK